LCGYCRHAIMMSMFGIVVLSKLKHFCFCWGNGYGSSIDPLCARPKDCCILYIYILKNESQQVITNHNFPQNSWLIYCHSYVKYKNLAIVGFWQQKAFHFIDFYKYNNWNILCIWSIAIIFKKDFMYKPSLLRHVISMQTIIFQSSGLFLKHRNPIKCFR
jgi:hypothetical protein